MNENYENEQIKICSEQLLKTKWIVKNTTNGRIEKSQMRIL